MVSRVTQLESAAPLTAFGYSVYAFAITACEVLEPNQIPYGYVQASLVEERVLKGERCLIPSTSAELQAVIRKCWKAGKGYYERLTER